MKLKTLIVALSSLGFTGQSMANSFVNEMLAPTIISSETSAKSPWYNTTLTKKNILNSNAQSIPELLKLIPGFTYGTPFGSYHTATYRGMADEYPRRMRLEVDGVPINLASTGSTFWGALPFSVEDIDRITFVSNPSSAINGDQAINGVLKIFTIRADEQNNKVSTSVSNKNLKRVYFRQGGFVSEDLAVQVSASKMKSDGEFQLKSSEDKSKVWANVFYTVDAKNTITGNFGVGQSLDDEDADEDLRYIPAYGNRAIKNVQGNVTWVNTDNGVITATAGINYLDNKTSNKLDNGFLFDISYDSLRAFASLDYKKQLTDSFTYFSGVSAISDRETPHYWSTEDEKWTSNKFRVYLGGDYQLADNLVLSGGIGVDSHSYYDNAWNYYLSALKDIDGQSSVAINYSTGSRFPVHWESKTQHYLINDSGFKLTRNQSFKEDVETEKLESLSVIYQYAKNNKNKLSARIYHDNYRDLIHTYYRAPLNGAVGAYGGQVISHGSGDKLTVNGLELNTSWELMSNLKSTVSYSHNNSIDHSGNVLERDKTIPDDILTVGLNYQIGKTKVNGYLTYMSEVTWDSQDVTNEVMVNDGYHTATVNVSHCMNMKATSELCLTAAAHNILNPDSNFYKKEDNTISDTQWIFKADYAF